MLANFKCLCDCVCDVCVLAGMYHYRVILFVLQTDASMCGMSGVLNVIRDGAELPVGFYSRQLRNAETHYSATELECLAVVEAVRHFEVHLHGQPFNVETDHRALELLLSSRVLNHKLTRWALFLL